LEISVLAGFIIVIKGESEVCSGSYILGEKQASGELVMLRAEVGHEDNLGERAIGSVRLYPAGKREEIEEDVGKKWGFASGFWAIGKDIREGGGEINAKVRF
jgi:hypothetical protein